MLILLLIACGGGGDSSRPVAIVPETPSPPTAMPDPTPPLEPPFEGCSADPCTSEDIAAIHRHNQQAIRLRQMEDARRLELPFQETKHAQQAPVVAYDLLSKHEIIYGTGGPSVDPQPNPGRSTLRLGTNDPYPAPDYLSVGVMPRRLGEWRAFNGFPAFREGKRFITTATTTRDQININYGIEEGYPWTSTVREYLNAIGVRFEQINRHAIVRMREGSTEEELDLTVRAIQAINSALPVEYHMQMASGQKPHGQAPASHEITVTFAPINQWPGWEETEASSVIGWARAVGETLGTEVWIRGPVVMRPDYADAGRLSAVVHEFLHALGFWSHVEQGIGVTPEQGVWYGEGSSIMEAGGDLYGNGGTLHPIDRAALLAAFTDPENLAGWTQESLQIHGRLILDRLPMDFGATYRNGHATAWALGEAPSTFLTDNPQFDGVVTWTGALLGFAPSTQSVTGEARVSVNLEHLNGLAEFTSMEKWTRGPGEQGSGVIWGDGDLAYSITVTGNTFTQTGGDSGVLTGAFFGKDHHGMGGTLYREDLTAGFGGKR